MTLRDDILITSRVISDSRTSDDGSIVAQLVRRGYGPLQAELLVAFVPLGLGRAVIGRLPISPPVRLSDTALIRDPKQGKLYEIPLAVVPEFEHARELGEETFATGIISRAQIEAVSFRSVELQVINQALKSKAELGSAKVEAPVLLRLTEAPKFLEWYRDLKSNTSPNNQVSAIY